MARMDYWEVVALCVALGLCHFVGLSVVPIGKDPEVASAPASFWAVGLLFDGSPEMGCVCGVEVFYQLLPGGELGTAVRFERLGQTWDLLLLKPELDNLNESLLDFVLPAINPLSGRNFVF